MEICQCDSINKRLKISLYFSKFSMSYCKKSDRYYQTDLAQPDQWMIYAAESDGKQSTQSNPWMNPTHV